MALPTDAALKASTFLENNLINSRISLLSLAFLISIWSSHSKLQTLFLKSDGILLALELQTSKFTQFGVVQSY